MKTLVLGIVLLAAGSVAAQAEDRKCIREMYELYGDLRSAGIDVKRQCDPKNFVTNPNEYGWICIDRDGGAGLVRQKGAGAKQKKDALCD